MPRKSKKTKVEVVVETQPKKATTPARKRTRRKGGGGGGGGARGAYISTAATVSGMMNSSVRMKGVDRFAHISDISDKAEGTVLLDVPLSCGSLARLSHMASAYQRIRWHSLRFRVEPMSPTTVSGGYIAAFLRDAEDVIAAGPAALAQMVSQRGSKVCKAWQSTTILSNALPDLLYTSVTKNEARFWSPGRFALAVDSKIASNPTTAIPVTVYVDWDVTFSSPSLEMGESVGPVTVEANFYARSSNVGLWWSDASGGDDPRSKIPLIKFDIIYNLPSRRFCGFTGEAGSYSQVVMVNDKTHGVTLYIVGFKGTAVVETADKNYFVLEKGEQLTPAAPLNSLQGLQHLCSHQIESFSLGLETLSIE